MSQLPTFTIEQGMMKLAFRDMPLWRGVQKSPGVTDSLPFVLVGGGGGPIRQLMEESVLNRVVKDYHSDDYKFITPPPGSSKWANSLGERNVEIIEKVIEKNYPRNIMEIGAGTTWVASKLIKSLKPETYYAIDPTLQTTNEKINVIRDYYPTDKLREKYFDLIIGFNVLEHVSDPMIFMNNIRKNLSDGGMAILTFPDCEGQFKRGDINVLIHEHVSYFTEESILWITKIIGFDVISLDSKNDLFTLVIQKSQKKHEVKTQNINELILLKYGAEMFINLLDKVTEKIRISLKENNNLAFHGATQGLNTFFHLTGLGEHPNISIYDGDRSKSGMYLPASVAPIKHYTDESYGENSMIVISAMSFYQQILDVIISKNKYSEHQIIPLAADAL